MTRLEEEIKQAMVIASWENVAASETVVTTKAAAEVAKKYIIKAIFDLSDMNTERIDTNEWREKWLKDNGII